MVKGQIAGAPVEIGPGRRLGTEDPRAPLHHVQVDLEDPLLGEEELQTFCYHRFIQLPNKRAVRSEVKVFGQLLGESTSSLNLASVRPQVGQRLP